MVGVFVWARFVTSVSGVRELGRTTRAARSMRPPVPPPPSTDPSEHERNPPTSLKRGEGVPGQGNAIDVTAHTPQERGGADR